MPYKDLPDFLSALEHKGLLRRIKTEVSQDLEIAEITDRTTKKGGPALLFENVKGHSVPVAINLFGSNARMALALEAESLEKLPERLGTHPFRHAASGSTILLRGVRERCLSIGGMTAQSSRIPISLSTRFISAAH